MKQKNNSSLFLPSWGNSEGPVSPEAPSASWPAWHSDLGEKEEAEKISVEVRTA